MGMTIVEDFKKIITKEIIDDIKNDNFTLLLGCGISYSAGIPRTDELVDRIISKYDNYKKFIEKNGVNTPPKIWFRIMYEKMPNYNNVVECCAGTPKERTDFLSPFFTCSTPSVAHQIIAQFCKKHYFSKIITTNFDKLLEKSLYDIDVFPYIYTPNNKKDEPREGEISIVKVNGDYLDHVTKNVIGESNLLDLDLRCFIKTHMLSSHRSLIIVGWSGDYDKDLYDSIVYLLRKGILKRVFYIDENFGLGSNFFSLGLIKGELESIKCNSDIFFILLRDIIVASENTSNTFLKDANIHNTYTEEDTDSIKEQAHNTHTSDATENVDKIINLLYFPLLLFHLFSSNNIDDATCEEIIKKKYNILLSYNKVPINLLCKVYKDDNKYNGILKDIKIAKLLGYVVDDSEISMKYKMESICNYYYNKKTIVDNFFKDKDKVKEKVEQLLEYLGSVLWDKSIDSIEKNDNFKELFGVVLISMLWCFYNDDSDLKKELMCVATYFTNQGTEMNEYLNDILNWGFEGVQQYIINRKNEIERILKED